MKNDIAKVLHLRLFRNNCYVHMIIILKKLKKQVGDKFRKIFDDRLQWTKQDFIGHLILLQRNVTFVEVLFSIKKT